MRSFAPILAVALTFCLTISTTSTAGAPTLVPGTAPAVLFITLGGDDSCLQTKNPAVSPLQGPWRTWLHVQLHDRLIPLLEARDPNFTYVHLSTCFGRTRSGLKWHDDLRIWDSTSNRMQIFALGDLWAKPKNKKYDWAVEKVTSEIKQILAAYDKSVPVYIMAHSYGAWTAMHSLQRRLAPLRVAGAPSPANVRALFTLDPISPNFCSPRLYLDEFPKIPKGCRQAPSDFGSADQVRLLQLLGGHWWNFYEDQDIWLHSGPIAALKAVGQDTQIAVDPHFVLIGGQHDKLMVNDGVWGQISAFVLGDL